MNLKFTKPFAPVGLVKACKKFPYPLLKLRMNKISRQVSGNEMEEASANLVLYLLHGAFILMWYALVFECWMVYVMGYFFYWLVVNIIGIIKDNN